MVTPCKVYRKLHVQHEDGFMSYEEKTVCETVCHYHTINKSLMEYADKDSVVSAFRFCLPKDTDIKINDIICAENRKYTVLHISEASRMFETVCEATAYE